MFVEPPQLVILFIFLFAATIVASIMSILNAHRADKLKDDMAELRQDLQDTSERIHDRIDGTDNRR